MQAGGGLSHKAADTRDADVIPNIARNTLEMISPAALSLFWLPYRYYTAKAPAFVEAGAVLGLVLRSESSLAPPRF